MASSSSKLHVIVEVIVLVLILPFNNVLGLLSRYYYVFNHLAAAIFDTLLESDAAVRYV